MSTTATNLTWEVSPVGEYVTMDEATRFSLKLARTSLNRNSANYPEQVYDNGVCIYICLNTWLFLVDDLGYHDAAVYLHTYLNTVCQGDMRKLFATLSDTVSKILPNLTFEWVERHGLDSFDLLSDAWPELAATMQLGEPREGHCIIPDALIILRYPKRLTPMHWDEQSEASLKEFFKVDAERMGCRDIDSPDPDPYFGDNFEVEHAYLISWLKEVFSDFLDSEAKKGHIYIDTDDVSLPSGAVNNACNNPICKALTYHGWAMEAGGEAPRRTPWLRVQRTEWLPGVVKRDELVKPVVAVDVDGHNMAMYRNVNFLHIGVSDLRMEYVTPMVVPKSFDAGRVIAPGSVQGYVRMRQRAKSLERILPHIGKYWHGSIDLHDQTYSQDYAYKGSINGSISTIDASGGSDRIKKRVELCVCPNWYASFYVNECESYLRYKDKLRLCHMVATSGNPFTFINESIFYGALHELAYRIYCRFTRTSIKRLKPWRVYGDDGECDSRVFDLLCDLYEVFGLKVNRSKSYGGDSAFKESCGGEYLFGYDINPIYFPRARWKNTDDVYLSLNNALYEYCLDEGITNSKVMAFIRQAIRDRFPKATFLPYSLTTGGLLGEQLSYPVRMQTHGTVEREANRCVNGRYTLASAADHHYFPYETYIRMDDLWELNSRRGHRRINPLCVCRELSLKEYRLWYEEYSYYDFLENGPTYLNEFDRLLGISQPRKTLEEVLCSQLDPHFWVQ